MKLLKSFAIALVVYAGIVLAFESAIGVLQPRSENTLVITTTDGEGNSSDRVVTKLESGGHLYVAANHWPRRWYRQALENPEVQATWDGEKRAYRAVPVTGQERDHVNDENGTGLFFRFLTGFPPRKFLRLDPAGE